MNNSAADRLKAMACDQKNPLDKERLLNEAKLEEGYATRALGTKKHSWLNEVIQLLKKPQNPG